MTQTNPSSPENTEATEKEATFMSHLIELRDRILRIVLVVTVLFLVLFYFSYDIFTVLADPILKYSPSGKLQTIDVFEPIVVLIKVPLIFAIYIGMPYILYQIWSFIAPGLYQHEKRLAMPLLFSSIMLFYIGMLFAYFVVFPLVFRFLPSILPAAIEMKPTAASYLNSSLKMFFAFGAAFEVPIATILLVAAGITTPEKLAAKRRYVIVGAFVIGMLLTPPDIISQVMLALPMWVLFELGLVFSKILLKKRLEERAKEAAMYQDDDYQELSEEEMDAELDKAIAEEDQLNKKDT